MIINLSKFHNIKNFKADLSDNRPTLYFFISIDEKTPKYIRKNNKYILNENGNIVIDHGYDVFGLVPRVLKYIGETTHFLARLHDHYHREYASEVGKVFTHFRCIKGLKRLSYDTVRIHHETLLVKKYLPEINKAAKLSDIQKLIILNSKGKISPSDLSEPYLLHARDIYIAYKAWENEDLNYIKTNLIQKKNKAGITKPGKRNSLSFFGKDGKKMRFSVWFQRSVRRCHIKQREAFKTYRSNYYYYIKIYVPEEYEKIITNQRQLNKNFLNKDGNKNYMKIYHKLRKKNKNQPTLL